MSRLSKDIAKYDEGAKKKKKKKKTKSPSSGSKTELVEATPTHKEATPIPKEATPIPKESTPTHVEATNKLSTNQAPKLVEEIKTKTKVEAIKTKTEVEAIKTKTEVEAIKTKTKVEAIKTETKVEAIKIKTGAVEAIKTETKVEAIKTKMKVEAIKTKTGAVEAIMTKTKVEAIKTKTGVVEAIKTKTNVEAIKTKMEDKPLRDPPIARAHLVDSGPQKMLNSVKDFHCHDDILNRLYTLDHVTTKTCHVTKSVNHVTRPVDHVTTKRPEVLDHVIIDEASHTDTLNIVEIAKNDTIITTDVPPLPEVKGGIEVSGRKRLHMCHYCGVAETVAKTYKRCVK